MKTTKVLCIATSFLLFLMLYACQQKVNKASVDNANLLTINLDSIPKEEYINASDYFKKATPIILETNTDCLISDMQDFQICDNYIVVFDSHIHEPHLYVFSLTDGQFLHQVGSYGEGPGEYLGISDFTIDQETKEIYLLDQNGLKIRKYNITTGEYLSSTPIMMQNRHRHLQFSDGNMYLDANKKSEEENLLYQMDIKSGKLKKSWMDATDYNRGWMENATFGESFFFARNTDNPKYAQLFMDTLMSIKDGEVTPYLVVQSERWVDTQTLQKMYNALGLDVISNLLTQNLIFGFTSFVESGDFMSFKYYDGKFKYTYIASSDGARACQWIADDLVYANDENLIMPINGMKFADAKGVYAYSVPAEYASHLGRDLKNIINPNMEGYEKLSKLEKDANPVIFYYEFK